MLYIPKGFAHGFQTLTDDTELFYQITPEYAAGLATGVRWDDPAFGIQLPIEVTVIQDKDKQFTDFT